MWNTHPISPVTWNVHFTGWGAFNESPETLKSQAKRRHFSKKDVLKLNIVRHSKRMQWLGGQLRSHNPDYVLEAIASVGASCLKYWQFFHACSISVAVLEEGNRQKKSNNIALHGVCWQGTQKTWWVSNKQVHQSEEWAAGRDLSFDLPWRAMAGWMDKWVDG